MSALNPPHHRSHLPQPLPKQGTRASRMGSRWAYYLNTYHLNAHLHLGCQEHALPDLRYHGTNCAGAMPKTLAPRVNAMVKPALACEERPWSASAIYCMVLRHCGYCIVPMISALQQLFPSCPVTRCQSSRPPQRETSGQASTTSSRCPLGHPALP